jgi:hypothetical protein
MSDPNLTLTEEIKNREHNSITIHRLPKRIEIKWYRFLKMQLYA